MKKKNVSKLATVKKVSTVKMVSYSIKMVIPTGAYANIQPEIIVKASNPEDALNYISPHMNRMWKEYFMVNERREEVTPTVGTCPVASISTIPVIPVTPTTPTTPVTPIVEAPPTSNVAVIKATQAIESCMSLEALDLIKNQVELSVKLVKEEKPKLRGMISEKFNELNADAFIKKNGG